MKSRDSAAAATGDTSALEQELAAQLRHAGFTVVEGDEQRRPTLVAYSPSHGVVAVDVAAHSDDPVVELNRRVAELRQDIPLLAEQKITRRVVDVSAQSGTSKILTAEEARGSAWVEDLPQRPLDAETLSALAHQLCPTLTFDSPRRGTLVDDGAVGRAASRIVLDAEQASIAMRPVRDVLVLTGPPGSGKTLVLAARARWIASAHPEWQVRVMCFNRLLVPYLRHLTADCPNVIVNTFGKSISELGFRIPLDDEAAADAAVARALNTATPVIDALLIDEWQDFIPSWTELLIALVKPHRGGVVLAGDPRQALYRDGQLRESFRGHTVEHEHLTIPYRSTRQILEVTSALDSSLKVEGLERSLDGQPVDLIWAQDNRAQAEAVARDVLLLLQSGERRPQDVGVLYTRRWQLGALAYALRDADIPFVVAKPQDADALDLSDPTVKLITVHSSKGYEFGVVFLVGLDQLPDPDGTEERDRQGRAGYVGATRARDQLVMTYSRHNTYLERIRKVPADLVRQWVWPDDYPEA